MDKIKVLLHQIFYPLSMGRYYELALKNDERIDLKTVGTYTGSYIPWKGGMTLDEKYAKPPDIVLPFPYTTKKVPYAQVKPELGDWKPDLVLTVDAGVNWIDRPNEENVATVGTDGHCLNDHYQHARRVSDKFFNMHPKYAEKDDVLLHYVFCKYTHFPIPEVRKTHDAVLIGMPYPQRDQWIGQLRNKGVSVLYENRPIFDEYRRLNNSALIGLNWSSLGDMNARVFELMAMGLCPVIDRCDDLASMGFEENVHYVGFSDLNEAVEKVLWAKSHPDEAKEIAKNAHELVTSRNYTYSMLVDNILKEFKLI